MITFDSNRDSAGSSEVQLSVSVDAQLYGRCAPAGLARLSYTCLLLPTIPARKKSSLALGIRGTFQATVITASIVGSPVSALSMTSMFAVMSVSECSFSDVDPLDPDMSPVGKPIGNHLGGYYRGAVAYGLIVFASALSVPMLILLLCKRHQLFLDRFHFPSVLILPASLFHQGIVSSSVSLVRLGANSVDMSIGIVAIMICAAGVCCVVRSTNPNRVEAKLAIREKNLEEQKQWFVAWCFTQISVWDMHWVDASEDGRFKHCYFFFLDDMRVALWLGIELASSFAQGALLGVRMNDHSICEATAIALVVVTGIGLIASLYMRPFGSHVGQWGLVIQKLGAFDLALLALINLLVGGTAVSDLIDYSVAVFTIAAAFQSAMQLLAAALVLHARCIITPAADGSRRRGLSAPSVLSFPLVELNTSFLVGGALNDATRDRNGDEDEHRQFEIGDDDNVPANKFGESLHIAEMEADDVDELQLEPAPASLSHRGSVFDDEDLVSCGLLSIRLPSDRRSNMIGTSANDLQCRPLLADKSDEMCF